MILQSLNFCCFQHPRLSPKGRSKSFFISRSMASMSGTVITPLAAFTMDEVLAHYKPKLLRVASELTSVLSGPKARKIVSLQVT